MRVFPLCYDNSASIFGKLLQASAVNIWTDVDGVMSADPRRVPEAKVYTHTYNYY
jgi:bifunctional aspartokinase / homoserine dehydrogenase 1